MKFNLKKLMICGLSLIMMSGLTSGAVSAKQTHHISNSNIIRMNNRKNFDYMVKLEDEYTDNIGNKSVHNVQTPFIINKNTQYRLQKLGDNFLKHHIKDFSEKQLQDMSLGDTGFLLNNNDNKLLHKRILQLECSHVNTLSVQDNAFDTAIRANLVKDINQTRIHYGRKPLIVTNIMQQVANYRAPKVLYAYEHGSECLKYEHITPAQLQAVGGATDNWIHGVDTHTDSSRYLAKRGYMNATGANAGGYYTWQTEHAGDHVPLTYPIGTPAHIAYDMNDDYMNHDDFYPARNGHRKNELDPNYKYLGVGVAYDPNTHFYADNEQFSV